MPRKEPLELEIAGGDVSPDTVDSSVLFELGAEYLELLADIAAEHGRDLTFRGLTIRKGSAVAEVWPSDAEAARDAGDDAASYIDGSEQPPVGKIETAARRVASVLRRLPTDQSAKVIIGRWKRPLTPKSEVAPGYLWSTVNLRAEVLRVGGSRPAVRLLSPSEDGAFTLGIEDTEDAQKLAPNLYKLVDVVATVRRDEEGKIVGGRLSEFHPVEADGAVEAWREWFKQACPGWEDVDDVLGALGRTESDGSDDRH